MITHLDHGVRGSDGVLRARAGAHCSIVYTPSHSGGRRSVAGALKVSYTGRWWWGADICDGRKRARVDTVREVKGGQSKAVSPWVKGWGS